MTEQELIQKLSSLKDEIRPSQEWLEQSEKELLNQLPKSQWPIYSLVVVLVLALSLVGAIHESPETKIKIVEQGKEETEKAEQATEISAGLEKAVKQVKSIRKELTKKVRKQEQLLATKIKTRETNQTDARIKLLEEIERLESIEAVSELLEKAKEEYSQGNFVIAREIVRQAQESLDNLTNK